MNTPKTQTYRIPVTFSAFGIANVVGDTFTGTFADAAQKAVEDAILPVMFDVDGGHYVEQDALRDPQALDRWLGGNEPHALTPITETRALKRAIDTVTLKDTGIAVTFRLGGIVDIEASSIEDAIKRVAEEEIIPTHVFLSEHPRLVPDAFDHGKQTIHLYDYQFVESE